MLEQARAIELSKRLDKEDIILAFIHLDYVSNTTITKMYYKDEEVFKSHSSSLLNKGYIITDEVNESLFYDLNTPNASIHALAVTYIKGGIR